VEWVCLEFRRTGSGFLFVRTFSIAEGAPAGSLYRDANNILFGSAPVPSGA